MNTNHEDLAPYVRQATPEDRKGKFIHLWHGTDLAGAKGIIKDRGVIGGERGTNAAASASDASQYPEDTGADFLMLLKARNSDLSIDPVDQTGDTVDEGLFTISGHGSSVTLGRHRLVAAFDLRQCRDPDKAIRLLDSGRLAAAIEEGVRVVYKKVLHFTRPPKQLPEK